MCKERGCYWADSPVWVGQLDHTQHRTVTFALEYAQRYQGVPTPVSNLLLTIARMAELLDELTEAGNVTFVLDDRE